MTRSKIAIIYDPVRTLKQKQQFAIFIKLKTGFKSEKLWELLKFWLSEKHKKLKKIFLMVLTNQLIYLVNVKTMRKIFSNYVCFSKSLNFTRFKMRSMGDQYFCFFANVGFYCLLSFINQRYDKISDQLQASSLHW